MSVLPHHTIETAPEGAKPLLEQARMDYGFWHLSGDGDVPGVSGKLLQAARTFRMQRLVN